MSDKPWTPGPWIPAGPNLNPGQGPDFYDSVITEYEPAPEQDDRICDVSDWPEARGEQSANAYLIAAAPELYEALEHAIQWIPMQVIACNGLKCREPHCESCSGEEEAEAAVQQAAKELDICRAALAKARGEDLG